MGLDIYSKSKNEYHAGYSGMHQIRFLAYVYCGGTKDYAEFMGMQRGTIQGSELEYGIAEHMSHIKFKEPHYDEAYMIASDHFRNLLWHSDCDGTYTKRGKTPKLGDEKNQGLQTGSSVVLLQELQTIQDHRIEIMRKYENENAWGLFDRFYALVKDVVENHDGRIEFH